MLEEEIIVIEPDDEEEIVVLEEAVEKVYPQLENLEVNPSAEKQVFNHPDSYGYDEVVVNAITGDTLEITPSKEEQTFNGVYTEVKSKGVTSEVDENITPNNIKSGVNILGVEGTLEAVDYWSTEPNTKDLNLKNYIKEAPKNIDVSNKTSLTSFFNGSISLEVADLNNWNTENCTDFSNMFGGCKKLKSVKANNLNTSKVTEINAMFNSIYTLEEVEISNWDTSSVTIMNAIFQNDRNIKRIDLKNWVTPNVTNMNMAFFSCSGLEYLDIRNFTFDNVTTSNMMFNGVPKNCLIIVKGETEKAWVKANQSSLTNIKTVAELGE